MGSTNSTEVSKPFSRARALLQAFLFVVPMIVTTGVSILLFSNLSDLSFVQHNTLSIVVLAAVIFSLLGMAGVQLLLYRIIEEPSYQDGGITRGVKTSLIYCILFSILISLILAPYFYLVLNFSLLELLSFFVLLFLFSATWIYSSAFWALEFYEFPALVFIVSYAAIFGITLYVYSINPSYTLFAYVIGTAFLPLLFGILAGIVFEKPKLAHKIGDDLRKFRKLTASMFLAVLYNIFYVLCVFLDKIIVWLFQGASAGTGLLIPGSYTVGSFLGLVPMLSVGVLAYFNSRTKELVRNRYLGTLPDIKNIVIEYKGVYWRCLTALVLITIVLIVLVNIAGLMFFSDNHTLLIVATISMGSLFLVLIVFNSSVLPLFGRTGISTLAISCVVIFELLSIYLVAYDTWFCALGFLLGAFIGSLISLLSIVNTFRNFEYNMFRYVASMTATKIE